MQAMKIIIYLLLLIVFGSCSKDSEFEPSFPKEMPNIGAYDEE